MQRLRVKVDAESPIDAYSTVMYRVRILNLMARGRFLLRVATCDAAEISHGLHSRFAYDLTGDQFLLRERIYDSLLTRGGYWLALFFLRYAWIRVHNKRALNLIFQGIRREIVDLRAYSDLLVHRTSVFLSKHVAKKSCICKSRMTNSDP